MVRKGNIKAELLEYHYTTSHKDLRVGKYSGLKAQKFLFFYNSFSMLEDKPYTDEMLYAYEDGPLYYDVLTLSRNHTTNQVVNMLRTSGAKGEDVEIDETILETAFMFTELFPSDELSKITHNLEIWQKRYEEYRLSEEKSSFSFSDFTANDLEYLSELKSVFSPQLYEKFKVEFGDNFSYLIERDNYNYIIKKLGGLSGIKKIRSEYNPIYIYVEEGEIIID